MENIILFGLYREKFQYLFRKLGFDVIIDTNDRLEKGRLIKCGATAPVSSLTSSILVLVESSNPVDFQEKNKPETKRSLACFKKIEHVLSKTVLRLDCGDTEEVLKKISNHFKLSIKKVCIHYQPPFQTLMTSIVSETQLNLEIPSDYRLFIEKIRSNWRLWESKSSLGLVNGQIIILVKGGLIEMKDVLGLTSLLVSVSPEKLYYETGDLICISQFLLRDRLANKSFSISLSRCEDLDQVSLPLSPLVSQDIVWRSPISRRSCVMSTFPLTSQTWSRLYQELSQNSQDVGSFSSETIFFCFLNENVIEMTEIFIKSCIRVGLKLAVFAYDQKSIQIIRDYRVILIDMSQEKDVAHPFVFEKFRLLDKLLQFDMTVMYSDVDVIVISPKISLLPESLLSSKNDMLIQSTLGSTYCTGFFVVQSNNLTKNIFKFSQSDIDGFFGGDQHYFNHRLAHRLRIQRLPPWDYPTGKFFKRNTLSPVLLHYNCFETKQKKLAWLRGHTST